VTSREILALDEVHGCTGEMIPPCRLFLSFEDIHENGAPGSLVGS
jgi:hypothetical protein